MTTKEFINKMECVVWRSVKDELPENLDEVLVFEKWNDTPFIGYYNKKFKNWYVDSSYIEIVGDAYREDNISQKDITHWMKLPKSPEGE